MGREVFTTTEWNSFQETPLSFKVKVEANEGIWVEQEKFLTMKNLNSIQAWKDIRANITSIEFHKDGIAPANPITSFDVTDETSDSTKGRITLYTVDDGLDDNTYKAIIVANDIIYAPENSSQLFAAMYKLTNINSKNFKVDNVLDMRMMFHSCNNLSNINTLFIWNIKNAKKAQFMFAGCSNLINLNSLQNWNVTNIDSFVSMFGDCDNIEDASGINNWDINANANYRNMFLRVYVHPEFTKFPNGTWDSDGTFTPNV